MLDGIAGFLDDPNNGAVATDLSDIYISAFRQQDVDEILGILRGRFPEGR